MSRPCWKFPFSRIESQLLFCPDISSVGGTYHLINLYLCNCINFNILVFVYCVFVYLCLLFFPDWASVGVHSTYQQIVRAAFPELTGSCFKLRCRNVAPSQEIYKKDCGENTFKEYILSVCNFNVSKF